MPMMAQPMLPSSPSETRRVRMPQTFFPSRIMSLGHLMRGERPVQAAMAPHTASPAQEVRRLNFSPPHRGARR